MLISTYEAAVQKNLELLRVEAELNLLNERLEEKVKERTAELTAEVADHKRADEALQESEEALPPARRGASVTMPSSCSIHRAAS
ncbi:MAG: hypothetical protein WKG07_40090 [Hymenobacter sp.]